MSSTGEAIAAQAAQASRADPASLLALEDSLRRAQEDGLRRAQEGNAGIMQQASEGSSSIERLDAELERVLLEHRRKEATAIDRRGLRVSALENEEAEGKPGHEEGWARQESTGEREVVYGIACNRLFARC